MGHVWTEVMSWKGKIGTRSGKMTWICLSGLQREEPSFERLKVETTSDVISVFAQEF